MVSFADLKKQRESKFEQLKESVSKKGGFVNHDDKCWKPALNKEGKGYAVIRFLPAPTFLSENERDYVRVECFNFFKTYDGKRRYYIRNSLETTNAQGIKIADKDPANTLKWALWNLGTAEGKEASKFIKNRSQFYANILILEDPANPENVGKVMPYKFGNQVFQKIEKAFAPEFPSDPMFNPFDLWEGRNFIVKVVTDPNSNLPSYANSEFDTKPTPMADSEEAMERIWMSSPSVIEWVGEDRFDKVHVLQKSLKTVLGYYTVDGFLGHPEPEIVEEGKAPAQAAQRSAAAPAPQASVATTTAKVEENFQQTQASAPVAQTEAPVHVMEKSLQDDDDFLRQFDFSEDD